MKTRPSKTTSNGVSTFKFKPVLTGTRAAPFATWTDWDDVVALGFWQVDWFDAYVPVSQASNNRLQITIKSFGANSEYGEVLLSVTKGSRYIVLNSFDALDSPGEYVLKRTGGGSHLLYFIPPTGLPATDELLVSTNSEGLVLVSSARGVTIENLDMQVSKGAALSIESSQDIEIVGMRMNNIGYNGVDAYDTSSLAINRSEFGHMGGRAISVDAGSRETLTAADVIIAHNNVHDSPRRSLHVRFDRGSLNPTVSPWLLHTGGVPVKC